MKKKIKRDRFRFIVEIPLPLHSQLQTEAQKEHRSRNAQIIQILEDRFKSPKSAPSMEVQNV